MFQSLKGFWVGWSQNTKGSGNAEAGCFNPWKGFGLVEAVDWRSQASRIARFQSLKGFWVGWSAWNLLARTLLILFQSLKGFWVGWSAFCVSPQVLPLFQSLKGFWVGWSNYRLTTETKIVQRFNPWKGFGLVEAKDSRFLLPFALVSIPERVLGWLKRSSVSGMALEADLFQSLKGFWVGWSLKQWDVSLTTRDGFQSLKGFWVGWSLASNHRSCRLHGFQSLKGFWVGWSRCWLVYRVLNPLLFQSLKGFWVGWSEMRDRLTQLRAVFQSLKGFWVGWSLKSKSL